MKKNFTYNLIYQILAIILPLITAPYISRRLGANMLGLYSKTFAVANYFYLFTLLGMANYGNRTIARVNDNRKEISKTFWELYSFQAAMSAVVTCLYIIFCLCTQSENLHICLLQVFYVLSGMFEINWFCFGMEKFKLTAIRSIAVKAISLIAIFIFVKDKSDFGLYTAIMSFSYILSAIAVWPFAVNQIDFIKPAWNDIKKHIKPNIMLFLPVIAVSLYTIMDKVILGFFSTNEEIAFYTCAEKIVGIPITIILALENVIMPRMSNIFAKKDYAQANKLMNNTMLFAMFISSSTMFGLAAISDVFLPWFYGAEYVRAGYFTFLLCPTILFKGWAGVLRTQYIIPTCRDNVYVTSLTCGAIVNLILDFILIPYINGIGAIIGTLAAEFTVAAIQFILCRKYIELRKYLQNGIIFIAIGFIMFFCISPIGNILLPTPLILFIQVFIGSLIYILLTLLYIVKISKQSSVINEVLKIYGINYCFK